MTSWYTENNRHFPEVQLALLTWVKEHALPFKATEMDRGLDIPYNQATAWISKLKSQGLLWRRFRKYGLTRKGDKRLDWLNRNRPETGF